MLKQNLKQFLYFTVVGASIAVVDFGLTFLLKDVFEINQYLSNTVALTTAIFSKFFLHRYWVFKEAADSNKSKEHTKFIKFLLVNATGVLINNLVIYLLSSVQLFDQYWFYVSKIIATAVVLLWNFFVNKFWTFKPHKHEEGKL
ncbi:GtrA family protein [Patescibacteria group bacterium]|nr:GtrA family protein [Patescibacteria group bacterium]